MECIWGMLVDGPRARGEGIRCVGQTLFIDVCLSAMPSIEKQK